MGMQIKATTMDVHNGKIPYHMFAKCDGCLRVEGVFEFSIDLHGDAL